jgi:hypothetical protein
MFPVDERISGAAQQHPEVAQRMIQRLGSVRIGQKPAALQRRKRTDLPRRPNRIPVVVDETLAPQPPQTLGRNNRGLDYRVAVAARVVVELVAPTTARA